MATTDPMTELYSRNVFNIILEKEIIKSIRYKKSLSLLMIDIDDFKIINDTYGHQTGDSAIIMPETDVVETTYAAERISSDIFNGIKTVYGLKID